MVDVYAKAQVAGMMVSQCALGYVGSQTVEPKGDAIFSRHATVG